MAIIFLQKRVFSVVLLLVLFLSSVTAAKNNKVQAGALASGDQEVPPVSPTDTSASVELKFDKQLTKVKYELNIENGVAVTQSHLHCGPVGVNGPIVAFLFGKIDAGVDFDDDKVKGTIVDANIQDQNCGTGTINSVASLLEAIQDGFIYLNVHTLAHPGGEVRGQVSVN